MTPITTYGLHPQALQAMGHDHETHKNGDPNDTEFKPTGFSKLMQIKPDSCCFNIATAFETSSSGVTRCGF